MKKILVTSDFSSNSKAGIRFALQLSSQTGYKLVFYHTVEIMKPTSWNDKRFKNLCEEKITNTSALFQKFVSDICEQAGHKPDKYHML